MSGYNTRNKKEPVSYEALLELLEEKLQNIATKQCINELKVIIENQRQTISAQKKDIDSLKEEVKNIKKENENLEQYGRRTSLRIVGIPPSKNETGEECLQKVVDVINGTDVQIPECCIDRAHRIGRPFKREDGSVAQTVIVKFSTWRHRTMFYRARKSESCKKKKIKIYIDLTKRRLQLLKDAREKVKNWENVEYVFVNVNCQLSLKLKNSDQSQLFNDLDDLDVLLDHE